MKKELQKQLEAWIIEQTYDEYSASTVKQYHADVMKFLNWLPAEINEINKSVMLDYKNYILGKTHSVASVNKWIVVVNKFLKSIGLGDITLKKVKEQNKASDESNITDSDYKRLLRWAKKMKMDSCYMVLKIFAKTGIRVSELKYFKVENLDNFHMDIYNKGKWRQIVIVQDLMREIRHYCKENNITEGPVIRNSKTGKSYADSTIYRQLKKVAGYAKINKSKVHPHAFRHYFANKYLQYYPGDLAGLADLLGHNQLETTRKYVRCNAEQKRHKLENIKF